MITKLGKIYVVRDETGIKIGSSEENHVENRVDSVKRNRGTGTCELVGISKKNYINYLRVESWCRKEATIRLDLPLPMNEWHNFKQPEKITPELLSSIISIINSFEEQ